MVPKSHVVSTFHNDLTTTPIAGLVRKSGCHSAVSVVANQRASLPSLVQEFFALFRYTIRVMLHQDDAVYNHHKDNNNGSNDKYQTTRMVLHIQHDDNSEAKQSLVNINALLINNVVALPYYECFSKGKRFEC